MNAESAEPSLALSEVAAPRKRDLRRFAIEEAKSFAAIFIYLLIVFGLFVLHEWIVLRSHNIDYRFYGFALINALILAKIILVAEGLHFAERYRGRPIIYPIVYKSVAFTILLIAAYIVEELAVGWLHGKTLAEAMPAIGGGSIYGVLAVSLIIAVALLPFFAFREMSRALGADELHAILFGRRSKR